MGLLERLKKGIVLYDGSKATYLESMGLKSGECAEYWNVTRPDDVAKMTRDFIEAGSDMIQTNTFSANRPTLESMGLADKLEEINAAGARIALECTKGTDVLVAASVGPTGLYFEPAGYLSFDMAVGIFQQQLKPLHDAGIRIVNFETFMDINEMRAAIVAARGFGDVEIICNMTFQGERTLNGTPADACAVTCCQLGADVVGANCSGGPVTLLKPMDLMEKVTDRQLCVKPNAGLPERENGRTVFGIGPAEFARKMEPFAQAGVRLLGGCCGSTPAYIAAMKKFFEGKSFPDVEMKDRPIIASPLGILDLSQEGLQFCEMIFDEISEAMQEDDFMSVSDILPMDIDDCDACIVDFRHLHDDFPVQKLITALTLFMKKPVVVRGGSKELLELFLRYYPGRAAVIKRAGYPDNMYGALLVSESVKPLAAA
ncbi:MAG: homocysteine methyltransferase [Clostridia bacterium]|nr:homocysteine methyltransferase [Clostridia bacterium]